MYIREQLIYECTSNTRIFWVKTKIKFVHAACTSKLPLHENIYWNSSNVLYYPDYLSTLVQYELAELDWEQSRFEPAQFGQTNMYSA